MNYFVVSIVRVFPCNFIFKIGKVCGNRGAFFVPVPLSLILISLIQAGKLHSMTWGKITCAHVLKALTVFGCFGYLPLRVLLLCESLFHADSQPGSSWLSLLSIACIAYSWWFAAPWNWAPAPSSVTGQK